MDIQRRDRIGCADELGRIIGDVAVTLVEEIRQGKPYTEPPAELYGLWLQLQVIDEIGWPPAGMMLQAADLMLQSESNVSAEGDSVEIENEWTGSRTMEHLRRMHKTVFNLRNVLLR